MEENGEMEIEGLEGVEMEKMRRMMRWRWRDWRRMKRCRWREWRMMLVEMELATDLAILMSWVMQPLLSIPWPPAFTDWGDGQ